MTYLLLPIFSTNTKKSSVKEWVQITATAVLDGFLLVPNVVFITKYFRFRLITADPDDDKFVDCAFAGNADFIVSNDHHFDVLKKIDFPQIRVISADDFMEMLTGNRPDLSKHWP